jgi:hypothetical protein
MNCGLKAYRKEVVKNIEVYGEMHRYIPYLAKNAGFRNIGHEDRLTIGKTYEVLIGDSNRKYDSNFDYECRYLIIDDKKYDRYYHKYLFKPLSEYRIDKIDKLLDNI